MGKINSNLPVLIALLSAMLFGLSTPISKILLEKINSIQLAGLLYLGAALILFPIFLRERQALKVLVKDESNTHSKRYLMGAVLFGGILGPIMLLTGLTLTLAGTASLLLNFETVATAFIAFLLFKEHFSKITWLANIGVFISGLILSFEGEFQGFLGAALILGATIAWGLDNNFTAKIDGISPIQSTFIKGSVAGIVNIILGILLFPFSIDYIFILMALIVGGFSYGLSIVFYIISAQRLGATRSQMFFASAPFWGLGFSLLLVKEVLSINQIIAGLILFISLLLLFWDQHVHDHIHEYIYHTHPHDHRDIHHAHNHADHSMTDFEDQWHEHQPVKHIHPHWPDLHHCHNHKSDL
jgi:drug/metabolite transporter (DMT)-like permease